MPAGTTAADVSESLIPVRNTRRNATAKIAPEDFGPAGECGAGSIGFDASAPLIAALMLAKKRLHATDTGVRFPRTRLVAEMASWTLRDGTAGEAGDSVPAELRKFYASGAKRSDTASDDPVAELIKVLPIPLAPLLSLVFVLLRRSSSQMWYWGVPGFRPDRRWLRQQWKTQADGGAFKTFALALTPGVRIGPALGERPYVEQLTALAFLEDLRAAYQPRLWRPWTWRRRGPVLILDRIDGGLATLLSGARDKRKDDQDDSRDPLLVVVLPDPAGSDVPRATAAAGHRRDQYPGPRRPGLAVAASAISTVVVPLLLAVVLLPRFGVPVPRLWPFHAAATPAASAASQSPPPPTGSPRPVPVIAARCPSAAGGSDGKKGRVSWMNPADGDIECVGYSSSVPFVNPSSAPSLAQALQDKRTEFDQEQVFTMDAKVDAAIKNPQGQYRGVIELVYFAGLTEGPVEDYDSGEAEELEGLYTAQEQAWNDSEEPYLKIIVANGGSKMKDAAPVASMIINGLGSDANFVGVVGLDRSTTDVQSAVTEFTNAGIPMLATTLSADGTGGIDILKNSTTPSPDFFSLSPTNTDEATLMLEYIRQAVPRYFGQPAAIYPSGGAGRARHIMIYLPADDPTDLYVSTLVKDLQAVWAGSFSSLPRPIVTGNLNDQRLCDSSTVDIYAGRHDRPDSGSSKYDGFTVFLDQIGRCYSDRKSEHESGGPFIIADDGVTRFIADSGDRQQLQSVYQQQSGSKQYLLPSVSYVTKGISVLSTGANCLSKNPDTAGYPTQMSTFCRTYAVVAAEMSQGAAIGTQHVHLLWTGERVGLAYDAAQMFLQAASYGRRGGVKTLLRTGVVSDFKNTNVRYNLVSGSAQFGKTQHFGMNVSGGMPLAIVRIQIFSPTAQPTCEFPGRGQATLSPIPGLAQSTTSCLGKPGL